MQTLIVSKAVGMCDGFSDFDVNNDVSILSLSVPHGNTGDFFTAL